MWRPGFDHEETRQARLFGYHRALCVRSFVHRGSRSDQDLGCLGLIGAAHAMAFAFPGIKPENRDSVTAYLRERKTGSRRCISRPCVQSGWTPGHQVRAMTYWSTVPIINSGRPDRGMNAPLRVRGARGLSGLERGVCAQHGHPPEHPRNFAIPHLEAIRASNHGPLTPALSLNANRRLNPRRRVLQACGGRPPRKGDLRIGFDRPRPATCRWPSPSHL